MYYNENGMRDQAVNKDGQPQYNIVYPEFKKGGYIYTVREVIHVIVVHIVCND